MFVCGISLCVIVKNKTVYRFTVSCKTKDGSPVVKMGGKGNMGVMFTIGSLPHKNTFLKTGDPVDLYRSPGSTFLMFHRRHLV